MAHHLVKRNSEIEKGKSEMLTEYEANVHVDKLIPYKKNPRKGDIKTIKKSLTAYGQFKPIVVRKETNEILAGNHTWLAAKALNWKTINVTWVDCTEEEAKKILLIDNRTSDLGRQDWASVYSLIKELENVEATGYDPASIQRLEASYGSKEPENYKDLVSRLGDQNVETKNVLEHGQVWLMGLHRLAIGDSSSPELMDQLFTTTKTSLMITDPPYGIDYKNGSVENDKNIEEAINITKKVFVTMLTKANDNLATYMFYPSTYSIEFMGLMRELGFIHKSNLIWNKKIPTLSFSHYKNQYEPCLYYSYKKPAKWYGDIAEKTIIQFYEDELPKKMVDMDKEELIELLSEAYETTDFITVPKPTKHEYHPTAKPVELYEKFIRNSSDLNEIVFDPFAGSGTIFIAAEKAGRIAYGSEYDTTYAYNILKRYQLYTGELPVLEETGEAYSFVEQQHEQNS